MALGDIAGLLSPLITSAESMHAVFVPLALQMLALAFTLTMLFGVYQWWLGEPSGAIARVTRAGLVLVVPFVLLYGSNWQDVTATTTRFFSGELVQPVLGSGTANGTGTDAIATTIKKLSDSMFPQARAADTRSSYEKVKDFLASDQTVGGAIFSGLTEALFELLLFALALLMSVALIFALYGPLLALHIGIIFGPLLIAWIPFSPTSHLARNWLQFMLSQGFALVVGITIAMISVGSIESFTDSMAAMGHDPNLPFYQEIAAKIGGFMASAAVIVFTAVMLFRADDLAAAMIGGGGGAGGGAVGAAIVARVRNPIKSASKPPKPTPK